ncbi:XRE family transcriptional regulator [Burkholderia gladioli]|uniref:XRE family transcriptional regulator n=1 Tax=Burkholderia gladioli TaxID=28095 RepID=UPI001C5DE73D|nr:XRE family transcriptional regulator [Burkholderia gladioli]MBW5285307.1 XRE family transcriptional regulator [Burkholderia gladioli]
MFNYKSPSPADLKQLKDRLEKSSTEMAELFGVTTGAQWRKYMAADSANRRDMGMHMLFFAMARLELDPETLERVLNRMRDAGATIELDSE